MVVVSESSSKKRKAQDKKTATKASRKSARLETVSETKDDATTGTQVEDLSDGDDSQDDVVLEIRPVIGETCLNKEFLREHMLDEVQSALDAQGWEHLFCKEESVDLEMVREFYQSLVVEEKGDLILATFTVDGETEVISNKVLARILKVPDAGYEKYVKTVWPSEFPKAEIISRVGEDPMNSSRQGNALKLSIVSRTLHRLLCSSITPRRQRYGKISFLDFLLLDKLLSKDQINLPKIVMRHMHYCKSNPVHGLPYPSIIKKILVSRGLYKSADEKRVTSEMNMEVYEKLSWWYDEIMGWSYERLGGDENQEEEDVVEVPQSAHARVKVESEDPVPGLLRQIVQKVENFEKAVLAALAHDSLDRVNLAAATERNTTVLAAVLRSIENERERRKAAGAGAGAGSSTNRELVVAGPVRSVPGGTPGVKTVEDPDTPVMK